MLEVHDPHMEGGHTLGPDDAIVIMRRLDDRADQTAHADSVAAHMHRHAAPLPIIDQRAHRIGILGPEIEDLPHLDPARNALTFHGNLREDFRVMGLVGARIATGEFLQHRLTLRPIIIVDRPIPKAQIGDFAVVKHLALARFGKHQKLMRIIAANRPAISAHRDRLKPHPLIGPQVADQMAVIGVQRIFFRQIKVVAILHVEFAAPHHAETRADLIAEFPLDLIHRQWQILVAIHMRAEDVGDQFLRRRREQHVALMPIRDAQHLGTVGIIAPAFAPQIGGLDRGHQHRQVTGADLFLMNDLFDLFQDLVAQGQPRIDACTGLFDQPCAQHQPVADDLRLGRGFLEHGQEITAKAHVRDLSGEC